ncbi:MAG TPA: hypothetical protein VN714_23045, partial [Trebonia sp.]|nr:hypothetical protein [Trebonia sp.]
ALVGPARDGTLRVLGAAVRAGVRRVVMTSAANAASPPSYASAVDRSRGLDDRDGAARASRRAATALSPSPT